MGSPSYVIGSSQSILHTLTDADRERLDHEPWVFTLNLWPSRWETAGFRPSVWTWGDTDRHDLIEQLVTELWAVRHDHHLSRRLKRIFVAIDQLADEALLRRAVEASQVKVTFYRRGPPWKRGQEATARLGGTIYHYGSTLTDVCNLAWILNPGQEIRVTGNEMSDDRRHWHQPADKPQFTGGPLQFWQAVKRCMWQGLADLRRQGLGIIDCNPRHELREELPEKLPRAALFG